MRVLFLWLATLISVSAWAARPAQPQLTEDEKADLAKGQLVTQADPDDSMPGVIGLIEIASTRQAIWDVLHDIDLVKQSNSSVTECVKYRDDTANGVQHIGLHYVLSIMWNEVSYYVIREFHPAEHYMTWSLDPAQTSDLKATMGSYSLWEGSAPGRVLLRYHTRADSGRKIPQWIQTYLTTKTLKGYLEFVKEQAEKRG